MCPKSWTMECINCTVSGSGWMGWSPSTSWNAKPPGQSSSGSRSTRNWGRSVSGMGALRLPPSSSAITARASRKRVPLPGTAGGHHRRDPVRAKLPLVAQGWQRQDTGSGQLLGQGPGACRVGPRRPHPLGRGLPVRGQGSDAPPDAPSRARGPGAPRRFGHPAAVPPGTGRGRGRGADRRTGPDGSSPIPARCRTRSGPTGGR